MRLETERLIVRAFERVDAPALYRIAREPGVVRFMRDWSEGFDSPESYHSFIDWQQQIQDCTDVRRNRRYAVTLRETGELIGMVGCGLDDFTNEVELAYFVAEQHQRRGYAQEAVGALAPWCFAHSELPYLILTIDCANEPSRRLAEKCGFELWERRTPIGHKQPNMESESYDYYRLYRKGARP